MATLATVTGTVRLLLDDVDADVFTDPILLGYVNVAQRDMWQRLIENGVRKPISTSAGIAVTAGTTETNLTLPARLLTPLELWEKGSTETDDYYIKIRLVDDLSTNPAYQQIGEWKWESGLVVLRPVDNNRLVKIQYTSYQADFAAPTDPVVPPLAENYLAYATAAMAARSRNERDLALDLLSVANASLNSLVNDQIRANQRNLQRARRFGDRSIR